MQELNLLQCKIISDEGSKEEAFDSPPLAANDVEQKTENSDQLTFDRLPGRPKLIKLGKRGRPRKEYNTNEKNEQISQAVDTMSTCDSPTVSEAFIIKDF